MIAVYSTSILRTKGERKITEEKNAEKQFTKQLAEVDIGATNLWREVLISARPTVTIAEETNMLQGGIPIADYSVSDVIVSGATDAMFEQFCSQYDSYTDLGHLCYTEWENTLH